MNEDEKIINTVNPIDTFRANYAITHLKELLKSHTDDIMGDVYSIAIDALEQMKARGSDAIYPELTPKAAHRADILERAKQCVCVDRNAQYGEPEDNFRVIAGLWESYIQASCVSKSGDVAISSRDVAMMMVLLKVGRAATADDVSDDTLVDIAGYAACAAGL